MATSTCINIAKFPQRNFFNLPFNLNSSFNALCFEEDYDRGTPMVFTGENCDLCSSYSDKSTKYRKVEITEK